MILPNLDIDVLTDKKVGLLEPLVFEKDERNLRDGLVTYPASVGAVVVAGSDLELSILHDVTCCNFYVARVGGRVGRNSNRYCLGYSLRAGLVFTKTPNHYVPNFGHKKAVMFGLRLARLKEFLRSASNFTLGGWRVTHQPRHAALCRKISAGKSMQWFIEVTDIAGDRALVDALLRRAGYELTAEEPVRFRKLLSHPKYREYATASEVHADAKHLVETLRRFSELEGTAMGIGIGAIQSKQPDGRVNKHIFAEGQTAISVTMSGIGTVTVTSNPDIAEEERQRLIEEAEVKAAERKRMSIIRRASAALQRPRILEVMKLMNIPKPTTTELGHIIELVQDECGGGIGKYASRNQLKRFDRSINHPDIFGLEARHAVSAEEPPPKPMDYAEAKEFARNIGALWLADVERDA